MSNKNKEIIDFLIKCEQIKNSPLYFNFINAKADNARFETDSNDKSLNKKFVDGSVAKQYSFTIIIYKSIYYNPMVKDEGYPDENEQELSEVQDLMDWINEQGYNHNFPDFGKDCVIDSMYTRTENPFLEGVNEEIQPPIAQYSATILIEYTDYSKCVWNN